MLSTGHDTLIVVEWKVCQGVFGNCVDVSVSLRCFDFVSYGSYL